MPEEPESRERDLRAEVAEGQVLDELLRATGNTVSRRDGAHGID